MNSLEGTYYHMAPILLESGSVINPGNFGRIINYVGVEHPLFSREMLLEDIRIKNFHHKPSRLSSCFVSINLDDAKFYLAHNEPTNLIYEVKIINNQSNSHIACFNMLPSIGSSKGVPGNPEEIANAYWNGDFCKVLGYEHLRCQELVVESPLRIISQIT